MQLLGFRIYKNSQCGFGTRKYKKMETLKNWKNLHWKNQNQIWGNPDFKKVKSYISYGNVLKMVNVSQGFLMYYNSLNSNIRYMGFPCCQLRVKRSIVIVERYKQSYGSRKYVFLGSP